MNLLTHQIAFNKDVTKLLIWCDANGWNYVIKDCQRSIQQERDFLIAGKSACLPENSYHVKGLAIDICFFTRENIWVTDKRALKDIGNYWQVLSPYNDWLGDSIFQDVFHFERRVL